MLTFDRRWRSCTPSTLVGTCSASVAARIICRARQPMADKTQCRFCCAALQHSTPLWHTHGLHFPALRKLRKLHLQGSATVEDHRERGQEDAASRGLHSPCGLPAHFWHVVGSSLHCRQAGVLPKSTPLQGWHVPFDTSP